MFFYGLYYSPQRTSPGATGGSLLTKLKPLPKGLHTRRRWLFLTQMGNGFIAIHRSILSWEWYSDNNTKSLFLHCLLKANWQDTQWRGIDMKRGQFFTSFSSLSVDLGISKKSVRTSLDNLKKTGEIDYVGAHQGTMITICKYDTYQDFNLDKGTRGARQLARQGYSKGHAKDTTKLIDLQIGYEDSPISNGTPRARQLARQGYTDNKYNKDNINNSLCLYIRDNLPNVSSLKNQLTDKEAESILSKYSRESVFKILLAMENKADLKKKYSSVNLTLRNWLSREPKTPATINGVGVYTPPKDC